MPWNNPTVGEIDEVHAEGRDDLDRLLAVVPDFVSKYGPIRGAVELTTSLLLVESWGRIELASALGIALVRLAEGSEVTG